MANTLPKDITTEELMAMNYRYHYSDEELIDDWQKLVGCTNFKTGSQFKPGMKLCQHFCDNFWDTKNAKGLSFADAWNDFEIMDGVREWGLTGMSNLWLSWIRRAVFMKAGLPNSSFYRPHFSKQVSAMTGERQGILFDPCMGWGGRMLGTLSNGWKYISCDPNKETFANVSRMLSFIGCESQATLLNIPVEEYDFQSSPMVDVVLTSPPYFNLEVYTDDEEQSYNKYAIYDSWRDNWLVPLIENCFAILKDDGISAWNVMNFKKHNLVGDVIHTHEKNGWVLVDTVGFKSPLENIRKLKNKDVTYIFRKKK